MSADATDPANDPAGTPAPGQDPAHGEGPPQGRGQPSEEELRAAYEAELNRITSTDMIAQAVVSLLNIGARRLAPVGEPPAGEAGQGGGASGRDLDQVRDAIDAVKALLDILERSIPAQELRSLRDALSQLQMAYAREVQAAGGQGEAPPGGAGPGGQVPPSGSEESPAAGEGAPGTGPAVSSGRLWVPGR
ncbi:MAG: hypothetical protein JWL67_606 [Solirubrobacterales bacterium]|jgi:hypothetical protein|nr:hypothetical protein [Solirubrobacterales bacterium]